MPAILDNKDPDAPSLFEPAALLRQARRQKGLPVADVPRLCVLDPDGDIVRRLQHSGEATRAADWPCYHTDLFRFRLAGETAGIIGISYYLHRTGHHKLERLTPMLNIAGSSFAVVYDLNHR